MGSYTRTSRVARTIVKLRSLRMENLHLHRTAEVGIRSMCFRLEKEKNILRRQLISGEITIVNAKQRLCKIMQEQIKTSMDMIKMDAQIDAQFCYEGMLDEDSDE